jgi:cell division protein FtsB
MHQVIETLIAPARKKITGLKLARFVSADYYAAVKWKTKFKAFSAELVSNPKKYVLAGALGLLTFYALFGDYGVVSRVRYEYQKHSLTTELAAEHARTEALRMSIEKAKSLDEIERIAREKFNLSKKGETIYIVK